MPELVRASLLFFPFALLPALFLCVAPLVSRRARFVMAGLCLAVTAGFLIDVAVLDHGALQTLQVPNSFPRGEPRELHVWIVAEHTAPASAWHFVVAGWFALVGLWLLVPARGLPHPAVRPVAVFLVWAAARLLLEWNAGPAEIVWAVGGTPTLLVVTPFVGLYAGRRGWSFGRWLGTLAAVAALQRLPLIVWGYVATTRQLGTHLDTHRVTDMAGLSGNVDFGGDPVRTWLWTTAVPHATLWVVVTIVTGLVLGFVPWLLARRRARAA